MHFLLLLCTPRPTEGATSLYDVVVRTLLSMIKIWNEWKKKKNNDREKNATMMMIRCQGEVRARVRQNSTIVKRILNNYEAQGFGGRQSCIHNSHIIHHPLHIRITQWHRWRLPAEWKLTTWNFLYRGGMHRVGLPKAAEVELLKLH